MPRKKYARINVPMIKTHDMEDRYVVESLSIQSTFDPQGTLTFNQNNGILTWNSGDITHLNFTSDDFMIMFDAETGLLTLSAGDKSIFYNLEDLKKQITEKGYTVEEMEAELKKREEKKKNE